MFKSYFKTAFRSLWKNKNFALINIAGLGVGISVCLLIFAILKVGIRKGLGASSRSIVFLFSKEFVWLTGIAFALAVPLALYFMNSWLNDFAYRISISWDLLVGAGIMAMIIALLTISVKAMRAALMNPVRSLRSE